MVATDTREPGFESHRRDGEVAFVNFNVKKKGRGSVEKSPFLYFKDTNL